MERSGLQAARCDALGEEVWNDRHSDFPSTDDALFVLSRGPRAFKRAIDVRQDKREMRTLTASCTLISESRTGLISAEENVRKSVQDSVPGV